MSKKGSFVFYTSVWPKLFNMLESDEERGQLIMAIIDYVSFETLPGENHSRAFIGAFEIMKEQLDEDALKWQQTVQTRAENGQKGGLAKASKSKQNLANASKCYQTLANDSKSKQNLANLAVNVNDNDNDNVNDNEVISNDITKGAKTRKRFIKPTVEEVREYCQERGNTVDPETFVNFYESKGWVVGKSPMKDWKAAVRNWERSRAQETPPQETYSSFETDEFFQAALERTRRAMAADN